MDSSQQIVQSFLESRKALLENDFKQASGIRTTHRYADLMDRFIRSLFFEAGLRDKIRADRKDVFALIALGGYGRRELCFGSDVDLMVVHQGRLSPEMNEIIPRALYPLWDAKLEVGHSIQTVQECIRLSRNDFRVLTSVMDARFLLGSRAFYRLFEVAFWSRIDRERDSLLNQFLIHQKMGEKNFGSEDYFVEPDIKDGPGGLRDLHFMAWMARAYFRCERLSQIRRFAVFSHFELDKLSQSKAFLLKLRNHLHILAGRKEDRLLLSFQKELSGILGYRAGPHAEGPEKFLKDLYLHLNRIRYGYEEFQVKALDIINPLPLETTPQDLPPEFQVTKGNIVLKQEGLLKEDPLLILVAMCEANRRGLFLGSGLIWDARKKIAAEGRELAILPGAKGLFLDMLLNPTNPKIIRLALEIGLIGIFIPEFKRIRNLAEFGFYHVRTVDLHSLKTLEIISEISRGDYNDRWPLFAQIFSELKHAERLFLAALLHDIGKGHRGDHSQKGADMVPGILKRLDISGEALDVIPLLVKHHLLLARISQRRDLGEEKTAVQVAQTVKDRDLLGMLFLLTVADSIATGPMASSDWKIMLLIELFFKVRRILDKEVLATPDATEKIEAKKRIVMDMLAPDFREKDASHILGQASSRYFLSTPLEDITQHISLALTLGDNKFSWTLQKLKDAPVTRVIQCVYDRPGLFSKMVGVFTLNDIKVLSSNISVLKNGLALDVYEVTNPLDPYQEMEKWEKIRKEIILALEDRLALDELIRKKERMTLAKERYLNSGSRKVKINNEASDFFTVIEVRSEEQIGLLYDLAKQVFTLGLDIRFAKVNSDQEKMTGVFYVRDAEGQKIHGDDKIEEIKEGLLSVMQPVS
ncbi:MAG: [protein-PII] uridylyltransferase [Deltaproteobacteria bacterium]|nr:[protein-PII] uridylyltransferase [Deltaproteobacteria bacterium]